MELFKVIIAGSRNFNNYELLEETCNKLLINKIHIEIVSGKANGADLYGEMYAITNNYSIKEFPANWNEYNKAAGPIRNKQMAEYADALILFWDGKSKGSKSMLKEAKEKGLLIRIINI